jgi:putative ABC transport system ATP-binding protein
VDEPTGNLDSKNGDQVMALLETLNKAGSTIVMVTHDSRYARCASRQIQLLDGQIVSQANTNNANDTQQSKELQGVA